MNYKRLLLSGLFVIVFLSSSIFAFHLYAQKQLPALIVHPSNFDLTYQSTPSTQTVTLDNTTNQPLIIQANLKNFTANGEEGSVSLTTDDTGYALAKWIKVAPATVTVPAHTSQDFTFTITPPANAEPGGHYGSIVFSTVPGQTTKGAGAAISEQVASLILYRIPGDTNDNASIMSFTTDKNFYEFGPVTFFMRLNNQGQVHIQPQGQVLIKGTFGDKYIANIQPYNVLPGATRKIPVVLSQRLLIGKYTAQVIAAYGSTNKQLMGSTEFYAFPVRYGLVALAILLILFLFRKRLGKALKALATGK